MMAASMALLQQASSTPLARAVLHPRFSLAVATTSRRNLSVSSPSCDPHVLLGMSEPGLQQLAIDLGQVANQI